MMLVTLTPSREQLQTYGPLAYVSEADRVRIIALAAGQFQRAINTLQNEIATAKRKGKI